MVRKLQEGIFGSVVVQHLCLTNITGQAAAGEV
jgi:hypothetical protein